MTILQIQDEYEKVFSELTDWDQKYEYLIALAELLPVPDSKWRTDERLLKECQTKTWIDASVKEGKIWYHADSSSILVKGMLAILIDVLNGHTPREIVDAEIDVIGRCGIEKEIPIQRSNGISAALKKMKKIALDYLGN